MKFLGIIPARYSSTRFPGKPLADLCGKTVIEHVYTRASEVLNDLLVATDDERIVQAVHAFGGNVVLTSPRHSSGTDRCAQAYGLSGVQADVVINIQGDEPFIQKEQIEAVMNCFPTDIATLVHPFSKDTSYEELSNPNIVKAVVSGNRALYFSRAVIPFLRGCEPQEWTKKQTFYRHIGMYAYRTEVLQQITQLPPSPLEQTESLEQLRWIENGFEIKVTVSNSVSLGIDTPADLETARNLFLQKNKA